MEFDHPGGNIVPEMTAEDLGQHLEALAESTEDDRDQLLHDLLVQVYPTKSTQDSSPRHAVQRRDFRGRSRPRCYCPARWPPPPPRRP